jgi:hypothetical protein
MRYITLLTLCLLFTGCVGGFNFPKFTFGTKVDTTTSAATLIKAQAISQQVSDMAAANIKIEQAHKAMELQYAKLREELQKNYDDMKKKDNDNFAKIGAVNYGIYVATQEKKKQDMNTLIAHLRSKEIMNRVDKLTPDQQSKILKDVEEEKKQTIDQLYLKYNDQIELAISEKADLDKALALIDQKEQEQKQLREAQKITIEKLRAEQQAAMDKAIKYTADQVDIAKANQKAEMLGYIVKSLLGVGIIFLVLAVLLKSPTLGIGSLASLGLAYVAATVPVWVIGTVLGFITLLLIWEAHREKIKAKLTLNPKNTVSG